MDDLIKRLEAATGPSRELDQEICLALGWTFQKMKGDRRPYFRKPGDTEFYQRSEPPDYTSSIDAALTLVPEGWWAEIHHRADMPGVVLWQFPLPCKRIPAHKPYQQGGNTTPIAICIAALKARL